MSNWISVKDRLPEQGQWVLVCGPKWLIPTIGKWDEGQKVFLPDTDNIEGCEWEPIPMAIKNSFIWQALVTHWMPLPEPPKGEL